MHADSTAFTTDGEDFDLEGEVGIISRNIPYEIDEDGYYRHVRKDGTLGSYVYADFISNSSMFFSYHDFQSFIRAYRYLLMVLSSVLGMIGILFGFILLLTNLCDIKSFGKPFLIPYSPIIKEKKIEKIKKGLLPQNTDKGET